MKSILYIEAGSSGMGGSFVSLAQIIKLFSKSNYSIHVILWNNSPFIDYYNSLGAKVKLIKNPIYTKKNMIFSKFYRVFFRIIKKIFNAGLLKFEFSFQYFSYRKVVHYVKENNISLIHLNNQPVRNFIGFFVAKKLSIPIVCHLRTLHGYGMTLSHLRFLNSISHQMIATSAAAAAYWSKVGLQKEKIKILPNPYDGELVKRPVPNVLGYKLVYISRLESGKGLFFLIKLFAMLSRIESKFTLTIIGDGSLRDSLEKAVREENLSEKVNFLGYVYNAKEILPHFDIMLFFSEEEGFGRVVLEGMAAGLPVIAANAAGVNEIIQNRYNGLLIELNKFDDAIKNIFLLYENSKLRCSITNNAYLTVKDRYSPNSFFENLKLIYTSLSAV